MPVDEHLPGYGWLHGLENVAVRTGVYVGICLSTVLVAWVIVANRVPLLEPFALGRNLAAAALLGFLGVIPILRFLRSPRRLLLSSLLGWAIFSLIYLGLSLYFVGLDERYSAFQIFMLGAVVYLIAATVSWLGTILWRVRESAASQSKHHVS